MYFDFVKLCGRNLGFLDFALKLVLCLGNLDLVGALSEVPEVCLSRGARKCCSEL